jgi:hypothetical protein
VPAADRTYRVIIFNHGYSLSLYICPVITTAAPYTRRRHHWVSQCSQSEPPRVYPGMGRLVQPSPAIGSDWKRAACRIRAGILRPTRRVSHGGLTQTNGSPENPGRFTLKDRNRPRLCENSRPRTHRENRASPEAHSATIAIPREVLVPSILRQILVFTQPRPIIAVWSMLIYK